MLKGKFEKAKIAWPKNEQPKMSLVGVQKTFVLLSAPDIMKMARPKTRTVLRRCPAPGKEGSAGDCTMPEL